MSLAIHVDRLNNVIKFKNTSNCFWGLYIYIYPVIVDLEGCGIPQSMVQDTLFKKNHWSAFSFMFLLAIIANIAVWKILWVFIFSRKVVC